MDKKTMMNGKKDSAAFVPDFDQWKYELDAFIQLDAINKPSFKDVYQISEIDDSHSNLLIKQFKPTSKSPVTELKFFFLNHDKLKKIEASYLEENLMMTTSRNLTLEFDGDNGSETLTRYFVDGRQKMLFASPVLYSVEGKVN
ncbi:MAG: hypothetical protein QM734_05520 [Cyclobacteriaceae bacterium]